MISEQITVLQRYFNELNIADHFKFNLLERQQLTEMKVCNREREGEGREKSKCLTTKFIKGTQPNSISLEFSSRELENQKRSLGTD